MFLMIPLATVPGSILVILTLTALIILAIIRLRKVPAKKLKQTESTYDKLWGHTNQGLNGFLHRAVGQNDANNGNSLKSYKAKQQKENTKDQGYATLQSQTPTARKSENKGSIPPTHTSITLIPSC